MLQRVAGFGLLCFAAFWAQAQTCTGLCLQQVSCPNGSTTSISGTVYAPNGIDPLPNVLVYIPSAPVEPLPAGLGCPAPGQQPSGVPLVGSTTAVDGTFSITNAPVGQGIPLVIQIGKWRRQLTLPAISACTDNPFSTRLPRNRSEGDIPRTAIVTSSTDQMECVLRAAGVDDAEFTDPSGAGRIHLFTGHQFPGAVIDAATPDEFSLMTNPSRLETYDNLLLPSQGASAAPTVNDVQQQALGSFINAGGRAYLSHFAWPYLDNNGQIPLGNPSPPGIWWVDSAPPGTPIPYVQTDTAIINPYLPEAQVMGSWMEATHVTASSSLIPFNRQVQHDIIYSEAQNWFRNSDIPDYGDVLQLVAHTPVNAPTSVNACGRLVFNDYEIRPTSVQSSAPLGTVFPAECASGFLSPEEKAFEYALFELTPDQSATLNPAFFDFGTLPIGVASAPHTFTWTNNSSFPATATPSTSSPDFDIVSTNCGTVPAGAPCQVSVVFQPTALGLRTGYVIVTSTGLLGTEQAFVQGTGTQDLTFNTNYLQFGTHPVGSMTTLPLITTNIAPFAVPLVPLAVTGDFTASTGNCGVSLPANGSCTLQVTFQPTAAGDRTGTLTPPGTDPVNLEGMGGDFSITLSPTSGNVEAGKSISLAALIAPVGEFPSAVDLTCTTTAPATTCSLPPSVLLGNGSVDASVTIQTTSQYTVPGYGLLHIDPIHRGVLPVLAVCLPWLWSKRRRRRTSYRLVWALALSVTGLCGLTGCSGKYPALNPAYTPAGTYTVTITADSGGLIHTAVYSLTVRR